MPPMAKVDDLLGVVRLSLKEGCGVFVAVLALEITPCGVGVSSALLCRSSPPLSLLLLDTCTLIMEIFLFLL